MVKQEIPLNKKNSHPRFAAFYEWLTNLTSVRRFTDPLRQEIAGQARGIVLEVGAGGGQNFPFYQPAQVERVEAVEPDEAMLAYAERRLPTARVSVHLVRAAAEALPFPDAHFDSVLVTLVFCSVSDPGRGLSEIWRVLKPGGTLLLLEHVRAQGKLTARIQDMLAPLTSRCLYLGNCYWNRDTLRTVRETGFQVSRVQQVRGGFQPVLNIAASRPRTDEEADL